MNETITKKKTFRLKTHKQRATFVAREMRKQGWSDQELANEAGLCVQTIQRFSGVMPPHLHLGRKATKIPRTSTTLRIFNSLGYEVVFRQLAEPIGRVEFLE